MENGREFHTFRGYQMLKQDKKLLTPSMEDYLEMIYRHCLKEGYVRINHLAKQLNVKASSVTKIVQKLSALELLDYQKYGIIRLTEKGNEIGKFLLDRHNTIETFLLSIGVKNAVLRDTEMIEHHLSMNTLWNIEMLNEFFKKHPEIMEQFHQFKKSHHEGYNNFINHLP